MWQVGDSVRVFQGDLTGAYGVIDSIDAEAQTAIIKRQKANSTWWYSPAIPLADLEAN